MNAKPPETFGLDRLQTPIGPALLVTDAEGALLALEWEDYEPRLRQLLRLQHGAAVLKEARAPDDTRAALTGYFDGDLDRLGTIRWRVAGTPFQRKVWTALRTIPVGTTTNYGALAARLDMPKAVRAAGHANGSNPILSVVDAATGAFIDNLPAGPGVHSEAAYQGNNHVFVPIGPPTTASPKDTCNVTFGFPANQGCVAVYGPAK